MNLRKAGLLFGVFGLLLLFIVFIIGIVIGNNEQTQVEGWNNRESYDDLPESVDDAEESNAFLVNLNMGLCNFGIGLILVGTGFSFSKNIESNRLVLLAGLIALAILFTSFLISIYGGSLAREEAEINNKFDQNPKDDDREEEIEETQAFIQPFNQFFGGFLMGSFGIGLAFFTILLSFFLNNKRKSEYRYDEEEYENEYQYEDDEDEPNYFSVEPIVEDNDEEPEYAEVLND